MGAGSEAAGGVIEVAVGVLVERGAEGLRVLIARRPRGGVLGGYWEFPGGKREPGETIEQCMVREFMEELGVLVASVSQLPTIEHQYSYGTVRLSPFFCRQLGGALQPMGVSEFRWVQPSELAQYQFPPANADLLRQIHAALGDGA